LLNAVLAAAGTIGKSTFDVLACRILMSSSLVIPDMVPRGNNLE